MSASTKDQVNSHEEYDDNDDNDTSSSENNDSEDTHPHYYVSLDVSCIEDNWLSDEEDSEETPNTADIPIVFDFYDEFNYNVYSENDFKGLEKYIEDALEIHHTGWKFNNEVFEDEVYEEVLPDEIDIDDVIEVEP